MIAVHYKGLHDLYVNGGNDIALPKCHVGISKGSQVLQGIALRNRATPLPASPFTIFTVQYIQHNIHTVQYTYSTQHEACVGLSRRSRCHHTHNFVFHTFTPHYNTFLHGGLMSLVQWHNTRVSGKSTESDVLGPSGYAMAARVVRNVLITQCQMGRREVGEVCRQYMADELAQ